ncbi:MAG: hypothetical protein ACAI44_33535 [Candidatus Sericytochromatia bacterium]
MAILLWGADLVLLWPVKAFEIHRFNQLPPMLAVYQGRGFALQENQLQFWDLRRRLLLKNLGDLCAYQIIEMCGEKDFLLHQIQGLTLMTWCRNEGRIRRWSMVSGEALSELAFSPGSTTWPYQDEILKQNQLIASRKWSLLRRPQHQLKVFTYDGRERFGLPLSDRWPEIGTTPRFLVLDQQIPPRPMDFTRVTCAVTTPGLPDYLPDYLATPLPVSWPSRQIEIFDLSSGTRLHQEERNDFTQAKVFGNEWLTLTPVRPDDRRLAGLEVTSARPGLLLSRHRLPDLQLISRQFIPLHPTDYQLAFPYLAEVHNHDIRIWDIRSGKEFRWQLRKRLDNVHLFAEGLVTWSAKQLCLYSADGKRIRCVENQSLDGLGFVREQNIQFIEESGNLNIHIPDLQIARFPFDHPDCKQFEGVDENLDHSTMKVCHGGRLLADFQPFQLNISSGWLTPHALLAMGWDEEWVLHDLETGELVWQRRAEQGDFQFLGFDGDHLIGLRRNIAMRRLYSWTLPELNNPILWNGPQGKIQAAALSGQSLITAEGSQLTAWNWRTGMVLHQAGIRCWPVGMLSLNSTLLAWCGSSGTRQEHPQEFAFDYLQELVELDPFNLQASPLFLPPSQHPPMRMKLMPGVDSFLLEPGKVEDRKWNLLEMNLRTKEQQLWPYRGDVSYFDYPESPNGIEPYFSGKIFPVRKQAFTSLAYLDQTLSEEQQKAEGLETGEWYQSGSYRVKKTFGPWLWEDWNLQVFAKGRKPLYQLQVPAWTSAEFWQDRLLVHYFNALDVRDLRTGRRLGMLELPGQALEDTNPIQYFSGSRLLFVFRHSSYLGASVADRLRVYDSNSLKLLAEYEFAPSRLMPAAAPGTVVLCQSLANDLPECRVLDEASGKERSRFYFVTGENKSLIITPEGYYAGEGDFADLAYIMDREKVLSMNDFPAFHRPDLVWKVLQGQPLGNLPRMPGLEWHPAMNS